MSVFKVMDGEFGTDGLISSHPVACFPTADECFRHIIDACKSDNPFTKYAAVTWWVEEHERAEERSPIYTDIPYPQIKQPDYPVWFKRELHALPPHPGIEGFRAEVREWMDKGKAA